MSKPRFKSWLFRNYKRLMVNRSKKKRKATPAGKLIFNGMMLTALAGLNTNTSVIYQLFALLLCFYVAARIGVKRQKNQIKVQRILPPYATAGSDLIYQLVIRNAGNKPLENVVINDNPKLRSPNLKQFLTLKEPFEETRNAYDRFIGFHRFLYLLRQLTGIEHKPSSLTLVAANSDVQTSQKLTLLRRGRFELSSTTIMLPEIFGLFFNLVHIDEKSNITVFPQRYPLPNDFVTRRKNARQARMISNKNQNFATTKGYGDEFFAMREYQAGDSLRNIHWASTAKRNKPIVLEHQNESTPSTATILLLSGAKSDLTEQAISVCATILYHLNAHSLSGDFYYDSGRPCVASGKLQKQLEVLALFKQDDQTTSPDDFIRFIEQTLTEIDTIYLIQTGEKSTSLISAEKLSHYCNQLTSIFISDNVVDSYRLKQTPSLNHYTIPTSQLAEKLACL